MSLVANIARAHRAPRQAFQIERARASEPRLVMFAVLFGVLTFVNRWPDISAISFLAEDTADIRNARYGSMFVSTVIFLPLVMYLIGLLAHAVMIPFGGRASWADARLAFFWSALVSSPLVLIGGALKVFSPGVGFLVAQALTAVVFFWQWATCIAVAEFGMHDGESAQDVV